MLNSRSIPDELWEQAREALVYYFAHRLGHANSEDLAQETLTAIWIREDFTFEKEEQFLRVCYGFASRIAFQGYREARKHTGAPLDPATPGREEGAAGMTGIEARTYIGEIRQIGAVHLTDEDWELVQRAIDGDPLNLADRFGADHPGRLRVRLFRIREKLAGLAGWTRRRSGKKKV